MRERSEERTLGIKQCAHGALQIPGRYALAGPGGVLGPFQVCGVFLSLFRFLLVAIRFVADSDGSPEKSGDHIFSALAPTWTDRERTTTTTGRTKGRTDGQRTDDDWTDDGTDGRTDKGRRRLDTIHEDISRRLRLVSVPK